jgi:hypothetical protein
MSAAASDGTSIDAIVCEIALRARQKLSHWHTASNPYMIYPAYQNDQGQMSVKFRTFFWL